MTIKQKKKDQYISDLLSNLDYLMQQLRSTQEGYGFNNLTALIAEPSLEWGANLANSCKKKKKA